MGDVREVLRAEIERIDAEIQRLQHRRDALEQCYLILDDGSHSLLPVADGGDFLGLTLAKAVEKLLKRTKRPAHLFDEILPALQEGGAKLYDTDPSRAARNLKIAVRMNSKNKSGHMLRWDPDTQMVGLKAWEQTQT